LIGSGGAARAIAFNLAREKANVTVLNRSLEKAQAMALKIGEKLGTKIECLALKPENLERIIPESDVLINATSIGMAPKSGETPVKKEMIHSRLVVFDIVYSPLETRLLREAREAGANTLGGLEMLVRQGAASFEIWTRRKAPIEVMRNAALGRLKEEYA
jgi:shikimate dehydrogenase